MNWLYILIINKLSKIKRFRFILFVFMINSLRHFIREVVNFLSYFFEFFIFINVPVFITGIFFENNIGVSLKRKELVW